MRSKEDLLSFTPDRKKKSTLKPWKKTILKVIIPLLSATGGYFYHSTQVEKPAIVLAQGDPCKKVDGILICTGTTNTENASDKSPSAPTVIYQAEKPSSSAQPLQTPESNSLGTGPSNSSTSSPDTPSVIAYPTASLDDQYYERDANQITQITQEIPTGAQVIKDTKNAIVGAVQAGVEIIYDAVTGNTSTNTSRGRNVSCISKNTKETYSLYLQPNQSYTDSCEIYNLR